MRSVRIANAQRESPGSRLHVDLDRVAKTCCDDGCDAFAIAFEERIGGDGRSHSDFGDITDVCPWLFSILPMASSAASS